MPQQQQGLASITAVISTRNRGVEAVRTVETILENDHPCFAVVLVDQSDDDRTERATRRFAERPEFAYIRSRTRGLSAGRNEGIAHSRSEFIAMTDDDCEAPRDWLRRMAEAFQVHERIGVVFGNVIPAKHDPARGFIPACHRDQPFLARSVRQKHDVEGMGACMGVRRSVWETLSGFDTCLGVGARFRSAEDLDFAIRTLLAGYAVYAAPDGHVVHHGFRDWSSGHGLVIGYMYGVGATLAKLSKTHLWDAFILLGNMARRWAFVGPGVDLGHKPPPRISRLAAFLRGLRDGMRIPLDRRTGNYVRADKAPANFSYQSRSAK